MLLMPALVWVVPPMFRDVTIADQTHSLAFPMSGEKIAVTVHLETVSVPSRPQPATVAAPSIWPTLLLAVYAVGVAGLLLRELLGWFAMTRLSRSSRAITDLDFDAFESDAISAPLTCGILRTRIILPTAWREWSAEKLNAVLAHERAHISRRDPWIAFVSRLNRSFFWFHPIAWWLERKLAVTAEYACDDEVARQFGESQSYARVLIEIAESVHRRGQRVLWAGVGVVGKGTLRNRIERLVNGDVLQNVSRGRKVTVGLMCVGVLYLTAACRTDSTVNEIAELRKEVAALRDEIRHTTTNPDAPRNTSDPNSRNPFHVTDVPDPDGPDVKAYAATAATDLGKAGDENSKSWVTQAVKGNRASIDGEWVGRWNMSRSDHWVPEYKAEVKTVGDRVYIFYRDHQGRFLADLHREKDLLVGRMVGIDNPADSSACVVRIVDNERLDGSWKGLGGDGRFDFRRKLE
jgi:hypothetical protein